MTIPYDPELAREELAQSRYGSGASVPPIRAYYPAGRPVFGDILAYFQDQWRQELDIEVQVQEYTGTVPEDLAYQPRQFRRYHCGRVLLSHGLRSP